MLVAEIMWGLMAPVAKLVLSGAVTPLLLTDCRLLGAALLFWTTSLFTRKEPVHHKDMLRLFFAALLGVVFNQGMFLFGLGHTSPINASVITTSLPILTMIISALYLREPVTGKKLQGVFLGALGALLLILSGRQGGSTDGSMLGDLLCLLAQLSFSCYLVFFKGLTGRYSPVTLMKWIFTYASICVIPFSYGEILAVEWSRIDPMSLAGVLTVVFCGTYISYLLVPVGQRYLRPTVGARQFQPAQRCGRGAGLHGGLLRDEEPQPGRSGGCGRGGLTVPDCHFVTRGEPIGRFRAVA